MTPYTAQITARVLEMLGRGGLETVRACCFGCETDMQIGAIPRSARLEQARRIDHGAADAIFVSRTATKALDAVAEIDDATGLPHVTSNRAAFRRAACLAEWRDPIPGFGRLMRACR